MAISILVHGVSAGVPLLIGWPAAQGLQPMPHVERALIEENAAPAWLHLPPNAELKVPSGVRLQIVSTSIVSHESRQEAALVGLFQNVGRQLSGAALSLTLVGRDGVSVLSSSANEATVSEVATNGFLPFRFPLVRTGLLPSDVAAIRLRLAEGAVKFRRSVPVTLVRYSVRGTPRQGTVVTGQIDLAPAKDQGPGIGLVITVLLLDKDLRCVEIVSGEPARTTDNSYGFEFHSMMPVARTARSVRVWAEEYSR
jgi:hypothetical protein